MKILPILFLSTITFAQEVKNKGITTSWDLVFSSRILFSSNISDDLNSINSSKFGQPINYLGISSTSTLLVNRRSVSDGGYPLDGYIEYLQVLPQEIALNDSLKAKINGFNFGCVLLGKDMFRKNETFDLITAVGFNAGRFWLKGNSDLKQKNPYFSPMLVLIPRINLGKFVIKAYCSFDYDISNKNWKRKGFSKNKLTPLSKFSSGGINLSVGLGYNFETS